MYVGKTEGSPFIAPNPLASVRVSGEPSKFLSNTDRKIKRLYHRAISFIEYNRARGLRIRYIVLTSKKGCMNEQDMAHYWDILVKRIRHTFNCRFEYIKGFERHSELGMLHLNVLCADSPYIPQSWLSSSWLDITKTSSVVWVALVKNRENHRKIAGYLPKYLSKDPKFRYSRSRQGLPRHFADTWRAFKVVYGSDTIKYWNLWIRALARSGVNCWLFIRRHKPLDSSQSTL